MVGRELGGRHNFWPVNNDILEILVASQENINVGENCRSKDGTVVDIPDFR